MDHSDMEKALREVQDALVVQGELEARLSRGLKQAAEWLESHESRLAESDARMARAEKNLAEVSDKLKDWDERIEKLVSGFGAFLTKVNRGRE
jgi:chromosome segregation ATPase